MAKYQSKVARTRDTHTLVILHRVGRERVAQDDQQRRDTQDHGHHRLANALEECVPGDRQQLFDQRHVRRHSWEEIGSPSLEKKLVSTVLPYWAEGAELHVPIDVANGGLVRSFGPFRLIPARGPELAPWSFVVVSCLAQAGFLPGAGALEPPQAPDPKRT